MFRVFIAKVIEYDGVWRLHSGNPCVFLLCFVVFAWMIWNIYWNCQKTLDNFTYLWYNVRIVVNEELE